MYIIHILGIAVCGGSSALSLFIIWRHKYLMSDKPLREIIEYDENGNIIKSDITYR